MVAAYSATVVVAAVPVGHMADRIGAHRMTVFGVWLLAASTLAFGLAGGFWTLMLARAGQGLSSSISWSAGLAWLSHATPHERRGRAMGTAMAYASSGGLLGPVFGGTLGHSYGIRATFVVLAAAAVVLALLAAAAPAGGRPELEQLSIRTAVRRALVRGPLLTAVVISVLVAVVSGTLETLVPLRLGVDGYSVLAITAVLTAAGVLAVITNWVVGHPIRPGWRDPDRARRDPRHGGLPGPAGGRGVGRGGGGHLRGQRPVHLQPVRRPVPWPRRRRPRRHRPVERVRDAQPELGRRLRGSDRRPAPHWPV